VDATQDKSGPYLTQALNQSGRFSVINIRIVPDDKDIISRTIIDWTELDDKPDLILTTGGTGFGQRDVTPEVSYSGKPIEKTLNWNFRLYHH
jgi:molybdenum cofactor synthesis domain-containing protein